MRVKEHEYGHAPQKSLLKTALTEVKTKQALKYKLNKNKLRKEREILVTSPVAIDHPTDLILLPYQIKSTPN